MEPQSPSSDLEAALAELLAAAQAARVSASKEPKESFSDILRKYENLVNSDPSSVLGSDFR